ncbi:hypothetical protein GCM10023192_89450 [Amycolatopsis samaneae]
MAALSALVTLPFVSVPAAATIISDINFECNVPSEGFGACRHDRTDVRRNERVRVTNVSSTARNVRFRLVDAANGYRLGETDPTPEGRQVLVWQNFTAGTVAVEFEANVQGRDPVRVRARIHVGND